MSVVETVDLCQRYDGRDVLKSINIRVERGEVFTLIGPTGAGKTTLLRLIDLLDIPASGKIYFNGTDSNQSARLRLKIRRRMAFVLQKPAVFNMSVHDNLACGLRWKGLDKSSINQRVNRILELVALSAYRDRNARTLSGGETQRLAIARAIATKPELLLLDEPTANLDPNSSSKIEDIINGIIHQHNTTIIMATHDMSQGQRLADRIGVIIDGEISQTGSPSEVFTSPRNREVAEFVGADNIIDGVIVSSEGGLVTLNAGDKALEAISEYPVGEKVLACIRPEDVTLSLSPLSSSARNSFTGGITRIALSGPLSRVEIDCGFPLIALVTKRSTEELSLKTGKQVFTTFKATRVHLIKIN